MAILPKEQEHIRDYWHILCMRRGIAITTFFAILLIAILVNILQTPVYQTQAEVAVQRSISEFPISNREGASFDQTYFRTQHKIIRSRLLAERAADKFIEAEGSSASTTPESRESLIGSIRGSFSATTISGTRIFLIGARGPDRQFITKVANAVAEAYVEHTAASEASSAHQTMSFLTDRLDELKNKLKESEFALAAFKERQAEVARLKGAVEELKAQLAERLKEHKPRHPGVVELKSEISEAEARLREALAGRSGGLEDRALNPGDVGDFARVQIQYSFLEREVEINNQLYQVLLQKLQEVNVSGEGPTTTLEIIERARTPSSPIRPKKRLNILFGTLLGLFLGSGLAFFQEYLDSSVKTVEDVTARLQLPVLGLIPAITNTDGNKADKHALNLISQKDTRSAINEAYRSLRTNLQFSSPDKPIKTILITSGAASEGKSTTIANLGIALAQAHKKVLLVDSDLRRSILHKCFALTNTEGLSNLLINGCSLDSAVKQTRIENLYVLNSGPHPPNPAEMLGSDSMRELIGSLREKFDIIMFDSPPTIAVTDAAILASMVDGVVLTIRAGRTPAELCQRSKDSLEKARAPIMGVVLNDFNIRMGRYYYYYHYYYYYSDDGKGKRRKARKRK